MKASTRIPFAPAAAGALALSLAVAVAAPSAPAHAEPAVEEHWSAVPGLLLVDLAATSSGLYAADYAGNTVLRIGDDGSATVVADLVRTPPTALEPDVGGGVLVVSFGAHTVVRIRPDGSTLTWTLPVGWMTDAVVPTADGHVYVFGEDSSTVALLGPDGVVVPWAIDLGFSPSNVHAAAAADGSVYFSDIRTGGLYRLSHGAVSRVADGSSAPLALTSTPEGVLAGWPDGTTKRFAPDGGVAVIAPPDASMAPMGDIASDGSGGTLVAVPSRGLVQRRADGVVVQLASVTGTTVVAAPDGTVYAVGDAGRSIARIHPAASTPPTVRYADALVGFTGRPFTTVPVRVAADSATVTISKGTLPPGIGIDPTTGALVGTPTATGRFPVQITVSSPGGRSTVDVVLQIRDGRIFTY